jgi:endonuclease-3
VVKALRAHHGPPAPPPTADPFALILWENVAYLASPARRREAFARLERAVGTRPADVLAAPARALRDVTSLGILPDTFTAKLRECARIAVQDHGGDLQAAIRQTPEAAVRVLRSFPGIGLPGAEKILLFTGRQARLAPESNGLRVLARLGLIREEKAYARTYAASRSVGAGLPAATLQEAHLLLQLHGQTLCKRSLPRCDLCPLAPRCAHARRAGRA